MSSSTKTPHSLSDFSRFHVISLLLLPHFRFSHLVNRIRTPHQSPNRQPHTAHTASTPHFQSDSAISVQPHKPQTAFPSLSPYRDPCDAALPVRTPLGARNHSCNPLYLPQAATASATGFCNLLPCHMGILQDLLSATSPHPQHGS